MSRIRERRESARMDQRDLGRKGPPPAGVRYLSDARRAVVHSLNCFEVWDLQSGRLDKKLSLPEECRSTAAWTVDPGSDRLVVGADDGTLRVLELSGEQSVACTLPPDAEVFLRGETPGLGSSGSVSRTDGSHEDLSRAYDPYTRVCSLSATPGAASILAAYGQAYALMWDGGTGELRQLLGSWRGHDERDRIYRVALSDDGRFAATVHLRSGLHVWATEAAEHLLHVPLRACEGGDGQHLPDEPVSASGLNGIGPVAFPPGSRTVAAADGYSVREWAVPSGRESVPWPTFKGQHPIFGDYHGMPRIHDLRFSQDGRRALTVGVDAALRVRELDTGEQVWAVRPDPCCVDWADLSPDGRQVVWVGCPGMRVFDLPG